MTTELLVDVTLLHDPPEVLPTPLPVFSFDVTVSTHDLVKAGVIAMRLFGSQHHHHRIVIAAETFEEAHLRAAQWVSCHGMVTGVYIRI